MIKKFTAPSVKEAIELAKEHFGPEAVILQTKKSDDGSEMFELTAMSEEAPAVSKPLTQKRDSKQFYTLSDLKSSRRQQLQSTEIDVMAELAKLKETVKDMSEYLHNSRPLMMPDIIRFLRDEKGVEENLVSELVQCISQKLNEDETRDPLKFRQALQSEICGHLNTSDCTKLIKGSPKLICLVGPTGVGKTTSIIKLATNPDFYGRLKVALITIDTYRVAAAAQLKTFAALAGLPLEIVYEPSEFQEAVSKFSDRDVVLVDTAGRSPLDSGHLEELKRFLSLRLFDEIHLVMSVSMHPDILVDASKSFSALPVNQLIISKIDETNRLGNILNVSRKIDLPISFLTNGQRVPDDIQIADKDQIARMIVN